MTRLKEPDRGQLLIFKELEWQTVRIEAKSTKDEELTPLRLLTNQARCRITIKKRIAGNITSNKLLVVAVEVAMVLAMAVVLVVIASVVVAVAAKMMSVVMVEVQCKIVMF
jgi:predicted phage tail protein